MDESKVYSQLYDIAEANLQKAGKEMQFTKKSLLHSVTRELKYIDAFEFVDDDRDTFLQSLYIALLFRTPEKAARDRWREVKGLTERQVQSKIFTSLISSQEFLEKGAVVCNNFYSDSAAKVQIVMQSNRYMDKLYGYYRKMPGFIKKIVKKILVK